MTLKNKITIGIVTIFAATLVAPLALAQNTTPADTTLTPLSAVAFAGPNMDGQGGAQANEASCAAFSQDVQTYTHNEFKALWNINAQPIPPSSVYGTWHDAAYIKCFIAQSSFPTIAELNDPSYVSLNATELQVLILASPRGVTQAALDAPTGFAKGQGIVDDDVVSNFAGKIVSSITSIINFALTGLVGVAGKIMISSINSSIGLGTNQPGIVLTGWRIIRDLMNMFFILALIVLSLGTILRIENYSARKYILRLVIMALLINFSLVIATTIVAAFDMLIKIFIPFGGFRDITATLVNIIKVGWTAQGFGNAAISGVASVVFFFTMLIVFITLTGLFVVRMVGLYVLLILSPVAYALSILPRTAEYASMWWRTFFKYLIWGPVAMFFIWLTFQITQAGGLNGIGTTNSAFSFAIITGFLFAAIIVARRAGMYGSDAVIKYGRQAGMMAGKWVARGRPLAMIGEGLEKRNVIKKDGMAYKTLGAWQKGAQYVEASPKIASEYLKRSEKPYLKGRDEAQKNALYKFGQIEDEEMLKNPKDAYKLIQDKLKDPKFSVNEMHELVEKAPRKAIPGIIEAMKEVQDADMRREANLAILKKLDERNAHPDTDLFKEVSEGEVPKQGVSGFKYADDKKDFSKGMNIIYDRVDQHGQVTGQRQRRLRAFAQPVETDFLPKETSEKEDQRIEGIKKKMERREAMLKGLINDPDRDKKILAAEAKGEIYTEAEMERAKREVDASVGEGPRIDLEKSLVSNTGKIIINAEAAEALGIGHSQDEYFPREAFQELKEALVQHGGVTQTEINKLENALENLPGIQVQRGIAKPLQPLMREALGPEAVREYRKAQGEVKQHEGVHRFSDFIRERDQVLYKDMVNKIINFNKPKFEEIKKEIQSISEYSKLTNEQIAEEIMAEAKYRNRLDEGLLKEINTGIQGLRKEYIKSVFTTARGNKFMARSSNLARTISSRNPQLQESTTQVTRRV